MQSNKIHIPRKKGKIEVIRAGTHITKEASFIFFLNILQPPVNSRAYIEQRLTRNFQICLGACLPLIVFTQSVSISLISVESL